VLSTDQKGAIAEAAIIHAALALDVGVARTFGDLRYDLIFDFDSRLWRVQCKWASRQGDVVIVRCYSARRNADGLVRRLYRADEIDAVAAFCADLGKCYFLPFEAIPPGGILALRLSLTLNNQRARIRWAEDFEFAATLGPQRGAVAQLGERKSGRLEATGSSPVGSTSEAAL
jgi:hypothetical protein